jgi:LPXTG-site transpeptidase (sortase) family protein
MNPFATGAAQKNAGYVVGGLMFFLTLSALNSVGLVPDYIDGTGTFGREVSHSMVLEALPNEDGALALSDIPRLGEVPVLTPLTLQVATTTVSVQPVATTPAVPLAVAPATIDALPSMRVIELPTKLVIPRAKIDVPILNPDTTNVATLDAELAKGVVRYTHSSQLNEDGNMFVFGHSSHLPVVKNRMFKALNGIEDLVRGDTILVTGKSGDVYEYQVTSVKKTDANDELIDLSVHTGVRKLTLSTCDSFGKKTSRFVVEAEFVKVRE